MKTASIVALTSALVLSSTAAFGAVFNVDPAHSSVGFKVRHLMISNVKGHFDKFQGKYELKDGVLRSLSGTMETASINTGIEKRDNHLRSADFFNAEKYPEVTFVMTSYKKGKLTGDLTMHGVTRSVTLETDLSGTIKDPWGLTRSSVSMEGEIKRSDFGLKYNQVLEAGGVAIGDEIKLSVELEGIAE